ncbi:MAG: hypothetical protein ACR2PL_00880 [Dehalococcoidia bacterium]
MVDSFGLWTLQRLGYGDQLLVSNNAPSYFPIRYNLPEGASQGPKIWYMSHLHLRIAVSPDSESGIANVGVSNNGRGAGEVEIEVTRHDNGLTVKQSSIGIVDGYEEQITNEPNLEARFANYLQLTAIRPGVNVLTFDFAHYGNVSIDRIDVVDDSGIEMTPLSHTRVDMSVREPQMVVSLNTPFQITYDLVNTGDRPAYKITISVLYPHDALQLIGDAEQHFSSLSEENHSGTFTFRATKPGRYFVGLSGETNANHPGADVQLEVVPPDHAEARIPANGAIGIVAAAIAIGLFREAWRRGTH